MAVHACAVATMVVVSAHERLARRRGAAPSPRRVKSSERGTARGTAVALNGRYVTKIAGRDRRDAQRASVVPVSSKTKYSRKVNKYSPKVAAVRTKLKPSMVLWTVWKASRAAVVS
eukprot:1521585-Prymnesium_polylepis.1